MPDDEWKPKVGEDVVVRVAGFTVMGLPIVGSGGPAFALLLRDLRPLPTPSPEAMRVVEAAVAEHAAWGARNLGSDFMGRWVKMANEYREAVRAHLATVTPPSPLAVALEALRKIVDRNTLNEGSYNAHELRKILGALSAEARAAIPIVERALAGEKG